MTLSNNQVLVSCYYPTIRQCNFRMGTVEGQQFLSISTHVLVKLMASCPSWNSSFLVDRNYLAQKNLGVHSLFRSPSLSVNILLKIVITFVMVYLSNFFLLNLLIIGVNSKHFHVFMLFGIFFVDFLALETSLNLLCYLSGPYITLFS